MPQRVALVLEYDGAKFSGYQFQNGAATVQGELERALGVALRENVRTNCAGRTDAGVHACAQVASFLATGPVDAYRLLRSLNALLPPAVRVRRVCLAPLSFHPRFDCIAREYEYLVWNSPAPSALWRDRALWLRRPLDIEALNAQLQEILGERDFAAFTRHEYREEGTVRFLHSAQWRRSVDAPMCGPESALLSLRILANAFLHNMIRILVGSMADISQGKCKQSVAEMLGGRSRLGAGQTAPAHGLYLRRAIYRSIPGVEGLDFDDELPDRRPARILNAAADD